MRLLYAMSGGDRDQQLCKDESDAPSSASGRMALRRMAGENEEDRGLPALRAVHEKMSLWAEHAGSAGEEL